MQVRKLYVKNFRGFEDNSFNLNPHFTVAIGDNGTGKSTLLHAMQVATGAFFLGLPRVTKRNIQENEIRFAINLVSKQSEHFTPTIVEATGQINGSGEFIWRRVIPEYGRTTSLKAEDVGQIREIAERYSKSLNNVDRPLLPLISFYGVRQLGGNVVRKKRIKKNRVIIRDGYYNAFGAKSDENPFTQWFYYYQEELKEGLEFEGTFEAVIEAIETAIPYLKNVSFDNFRLELVADCEIEGQATKRLPHSLMSDGVKRMLGIVTDIAYRCAVLNGFLGKDAVKGTSGVVMIDELDMHLHPNWQRVVVRDLKKAFPNLQFVVTTHSPFIVQSVESDELVNLDFVMDIPPNELKIDEVATDVMGVDSPFAVDNEQRYQKAKHLLELIDSGAQASTISKAIEEVSDPGLRAFLELNRLSKGK
ncbi:AAA family ATPase [Parapedobacter sp. ISTM3]|uniref:AAA family ATPase n=1 Tax=Parapedobacter sp. ISTM3 TaxID=2800130 RepID=UPI00190650D8|nr:AAA family ATPase [Parapedobacter sp. ISTM3]MBK1439826.1 AAA family ATPase [Parapedobacter sp. ISTM3]